MAFLLVLLFPTATHAEADARHLARELVEISYIESERRKPSVPDDFADEALIFSREQVAAATPAIRAKAERIATQIRNAPRKTPWLKGWPDPWTVRKDMAEASKGESELVIAARQAGRFLMFNLAMNRIGGTVFNYRLPQDVQRLQIAYVVHFLDLRDRQEKTFEKRCPRFGPCRRRTFYQIRTDYNYDIEPARDAATRYLPASLHEQFIDITAPRGTRTPPPAPVRVSEQPFKPLGPTLIQIAFVVVGLLLIFAFLKFVFGQRGKGESVTYGSAKFADPVVGMPSTDRLFHGVFMGFSILPSEFKQTPAVPIITEPENHTLIVAPTRTGKGTRVIVPTLLLYQSSLITLDPKGENAAITARYRRDQLGHRVHIVNPWGVHADLFEKRGFKPATLNPLDLLDRNDRTVVANAKALAHAICIRPAGEKGSYWQSASAALLAALLLWVTDEPGEIKTLGRVADLASGGEEGGDLRETLLPKLVASSSFRGAMRKFVGPMVKIADDTWSGIIGNLSDSLQFLTDDLLVEATDHSTFSLVDLTNPGTTVYLVIPDEQLKNNATWVKLLMAAVSRTFKTHKPGAKGRRAMFLIDEFPTLGQMDTFVEDIGLISGSGLDYTIAIQDLNQLETLYGRASGTSLSNGGWKWFSNVQDLRTAEYVSKMLGTKTQATESRTVGEKSSTSYGETARPLMTPDEVMALGKAGAIVFRPGHRPHLLQPWDYWGLRSRFAGLMQQKPDYPMPNLDAVDPSPSHKGQNQGGSNQGSGNSGGGGGSSTRGMNRADALDILGLKEGATLQEIKTAWKSRLAQVHPDKPGGSNRLTQQVNEAYEYLVGK